MYQFEYFSNCIVCVGGISKGRGMTPQRDLQCYRNELRCAGLF